MTPMVLTPEEIGNRISTRRAELNLTLQAVADKVQVQNSTIYRYEKGEIVKIKLPVIEAIASALEVTPGYLIDKPDLRLSDSQQKEVYRILDSACAEKNCTHGFAIVRAGVTRDFFPRLSLTKLYNAYMYDLLSVAKYLDVYQEVYSAITRQLYLSAANIIPMPEMRKIPLLGNIACGAPILAEDHIEEYIDIPKHIPADFALTCKGDSMINARIFDGDTVYIRQQEEVENGEIAAVLIDTEATLKRVRLFNDRIVLEPANPLYDPLVYRGEEMNTVRILGKAVAFTSAVR